MRAPIAENPLVSVIVRTRDRTRLLAEALASVAGQTHRPIEAVVVNDGGPDVAAVVRGFSEQLVCLLLDLRPGRGRAAAANAGIAAARGEWVAFLDDDDLLLPEGVVTLLAAAQGQESMPYGRVDAYFQPEGDKPKLFRTFSQPFDPDALLFENFIPFNACLMPAAVLREIGGIDESLDCFEDWDVFLRLSERLPFRHVDVQVAEYRIFDQAFVTGRGGQERQHRGRVAIYTKHAHRYTPEALSRMQYAVKTQGPAQLAALQVESRELSQRLAAAEAALSAIERSRGWRLVQRVRRFLGRR